MCNMLSSIPTQLVISLHIKTIYTCFFFFFFCLIFLSFIPMTIYLVRSTRCFVEDNNRLVIAATMLRASENVKTKREFPSMSQVLRSTLIQHYPVHSSSSLFFLFLTYFSPRLLCNTLLLDMGRNEKQNKPKTYFCELFLCFIYILLFNKFISLFFGFYFRITPVVLALGIIFSFILAALLLGGTFMSTACKD